MGRPDQPDQPDRRAVDPDEAEQVRAPRERALSSASSAAGRFRFVQVETPWLLGPNPGRYLVRASTGEGPPTHVLVIDELGAPERRRLLARRGRARDTPAEPEPAPVATGRATVIFVGDPFDSETAASTWLDGVGEDELAAGLAVINRALHGLRLVLADPDRHEIGRDQLLVARVGFGMGEQVADGRWEAAREVMAREGRRSRTRVLQPQARLAALLGGREAALVCEELTLRARGDLARGRPREAALGLLVALDAALAELPRDRQGVAVAERLSELRGQRDAAADAAQAALAGALSAEHLEVVGFTLTRIEAALRARAVASA